jgi:biopolymer transport protein ExbB/biopolymer transport protein TolQ
MSILPKIVVVTMIVLSVIAIAVGVERLFVYSKAKKQSRILLKLISKFWQQGKIEDSLKLASDAKFKDSHLAKILVAGLNELDFSGDGSSALQVESAKKAIDRATIKGIQEFKRGITILGTIGSTSPFIGLFGTVFGIINAFQSMGATGAGGMGTIASGIAEALISTGVGIGVAIVAVWFFNSLLNRIEIFTGEMANSSSELIDNYLKLKAKGA